MYKIIARLFKNLALRLSNLDFNDFYHPYRQVPIPIGRIAYDWRLRTIHQPADKTYELYSVFVADEGWYRPREFNDYAAMPAVLWAVTSGVVPFNESRDGDATCPRDLGSTTCHSRHSTCTNHYSLLRPFGIYNDSYTCRCWDDYQGNPYLPDGCQGTLPPSL